MTDDRGFDRFPTTLWTMVARAGTPTEEGRRALASVIERYLPALRAHLRLVQRLNADEAEDVLQSFVAEKFLEKELAAKADRNSGRFRSLLLVSLNRFLISRKRHEHAQRRDSRLTVPLADGPWLSGPAQEPETMVQIAWARAVIDQALIRMLEDCIARGRQDVLGVFEARVLAATLGGPRTPYVELAQRYKLSSPSKAENVLITGKRLFARALREVIAEYEPNEARVDQEISELRNILSNA